MAVVLRFASSSNANGLKASAFERSTQGVGLFFNFKQQVTVASDHATFSSITAPGEFAFRLDSTAGTRWRSGRQVLNASPTDTFLIIPAAPLAFSPAALTAMLPSLPITASSVTITSLTLTLGTGIITAAGAGFYSSFFGAIPATFTYVFTLVPNTEPADMSAPGFIGSALEVRTISVSVVSAVGGPLGFLANFFLNALIGIVSGSIRNTLQNRVQAAIDTAITNALASASAPPGTIATVETATINRAGVSIVAFAGFALEKACASSSSGGSVNLRPRAQLVHLRAIRDKLLTRSPRGAAYAALFEQFNGEIAAALPSNDRLLRAVDGVVSLALRDLPIEDPGKGRVSRELASAVLKALVLAAKTASPELKMAIAALQDEVEDFVDRPAGEVLDASFALLGEKPRRQPGKRKK